MGEDKALRIYKALLAHTRQVALAADAQRLLFYADFIARDDGWPEPAFQKQLQQGKGLGERMHYSFTVALQQAEKAIIVGGDIAQLSTGIIEEAFQKLDTHDYVIGPALDGGYYLLGMKTPSPELFEGIAWSTDTVFAETVAKIKEQGKTYALAPTLSDIDYQEDWEKYGWEVE